MLLSFIPRPSQEKILRYHGGRLGIAAVPGAGKTQVLSALAAQLIQQGRLASDQEILIVTLVNSAVDNFEARIKRFFDDPLLSLYKYRVRTLHALAHEIVREKPSKVGLEERFSIIDELESTRIRGEAVRAWLASHSLDEYLDPALETSKLDWVKRKDLPETLDGIVKAFISSAKNRLLTPESLRLKLDAAPAPLPLAEFSCAVYADYQRALAYRGAADFDDLIRLALTLLESDDDFLARLRYRYPFILEDEAQDSSLTQERILRLLCGENGNWVRVGDPNQAIFETFTTADPELLRGFIRENRSEEMPESGRSQHSILQAANFLMDWVMTDFPNEPARTALSLPHIELVPEGYLPVNPPDDPNAVKFIATKYTPEQELDAVAKSVKNYLDSFAELPVNEQPTVAVLVPRNKRGVELVGALRHLGVEPIELMNSSYETRVTAGALSHLLTYLAEPGNAGKLAKAYQVWRRDWRGQDKEAKETEDSEEENRELENSALLERANALLRKVGRVENFIAPRPAEDWLSALAESEPPQIVEELSAFRVVVRRWLSAVSLPIDQLTLTLAQDVFSEAADLALANKLALILRSVADEQSDWRLPELSAELGVIAKNQRRFIGFAEDDSGFDPEKYRGRVVVATMHKAKGLEWDRVYLTSVNNYDFPAGEDNDQFMSEKWFARGKLNLEAEALAQLGALEINDEFRWYEEGAATQRARLDYVKERLRLLYVGITRAKRELTVTWNSGRQGNATPALAFAALAGWREDLG
ncbi:MAG: ATP-dependent helicase [Anaerolineales bacterium]|nr:ATP-dependent helicase [Anaerolineales bacterium]